VSQSLTSGVAEAEHDLAEAEGLGINLDAVTDALVVEGVDLFSKAFETLLKAVADKRAQMAGAA
jgi:transaldolase